MSLFLAAVIVIACQTSSSMDRMMAAVQKQRDAVRKQVKGTGGSFFTTGWSDAGAAMPPDADTPPASAPRVLAACEPVPAAELRKLIVDTAVREGVNPLLLRAVIDRESAGRPCAVSPKGAEGLMQLMPGTSADLGVRDPFNAAENVGGGARYLKQMLDRYKGDTRLALAAYNAGAQRVDEAGGVPSIAETQAYVSGILGQMNEGEGAIQ